MNRRGFMGGCLAAGIASTEISCAAAVRVVVPVLLGVVTSEAMRTMAGKVFDDVVQSVVQDIYKLTRDHLFKPGEVLQLPEAQAADMIRSGYGSISAADGSVPREVVKALLKDPRVLDYETPVMRWRSTSNAYLQLMSNQKPFAMWYQYGVALPGYPNGHPVFSIHSNWLKYLAEDDTCGVIPVDNSTRVPCKKTGCPVIGWRQKFLQQDGSILHLSFDEPGNATSEQWQSHVKHSNAFEGCRQSSRRKHSIVIAEE